uniref:uncharacterized protein n=1 Tax=Myxine glutinosa TaxID=7769 RepID=UPI00358F8547
MASEAEPLEKRARTELNFKLCIKCQTSKEEQLKEPPQSQKQSTYDKFLTAVRLRAQFGNTDFIALNEKIGQLTAQDLCDKHVVWHRTCYAMSTNKEHIIRDEKRYNRACATSDVTLLSSRTVGRPTASSTLSATDEEPVSKKYTRSQLTAYDKTECFFCQGKIQGPLHECQSANIGKQIKDIVHHSNNQEWKVNYAIVLSDNDALSRDIVYHKKCITEQWQFLKQGNAADSGSCPKTADRCNTDASGPTVHHITAEIEFFAEIQDRINEGEFIPMDEAEKLYLSKMEQYNIQYVTKFSNAKSERRWLRQNIEENVNPVQFTPSPKKPTLIHSKAAQNAAVDEAVKNNTYDDMKKLFEACRVLRKLIQETKKDPWVFTGTLENSEHCVVPQELHSMVLWIMKGTTTVKTEARAQEFNRSASILSQQIVQAHKSNRQLLYDPKSPVAAS